MVPNMTTPARKAKALPTLKTRLRNSRRGMIGSTARRSIQTNAAASSDGPAQQDQRPGLGPAVLGAPPVQVQQQAGDGADDGGGAQVVDLVLAPDHRHLQHRRGDHQRGQADGQVDVEDPAPAGPVGQPAAQQRAGHAGDAEHGPEVALVAAALAGRDDVADDAEGDREQAAAADALEGAEGDQLAHVLAEPGQGRAEQEDDDRDLEDQPAPVEVGDLAPQRRGRGRGEQVGGDDPRQLVQPAELADDAGQGGADDALVEGEQQHAGHHPGQDDQDLAVGEVAGDGGVLAGGGSAWPVAAVPAAAAVEGVSAGGVVIWSPGRRPAGRDCRPAGS